ncbi:MAG: putative bifunctional diguanylate cyclase/phosphodiesterase [Sulfobacillus sp.]
MEARSIDTWAVDERINVLLVDDRPENLGVLEAVLSPRDYRLVKATSAEMALKSLLHQDFAVILLDVQMPGMNGFEAAKMIKAREKSKDIPIIFITAINQERDHVNEGYSVGAIDYIFKPFDADILRSKVDAFVSLFSNQKKIAQQAEQLKRKTRELEHAYEELSRTTAELRRTEALASVIADTARDTMATFSPDGSLLSVNPAVESMFGYKSRELVGRPVATIIPDIMGQSVSSSPVAFEATAVRNDASTFVSEVHIGTTLVQGEVVYACTVRDITERKQHLEILEHQVLHDDLTGLPNRTFLFQRITQAVRQQPPEAHPFALLLLDLDHFKAINDTMGHAVGDGLLKVVGQRLQEFINDNGLVVRLGGDEFAVVVPGQHFEDVLPLAQAILELLDTPFVTAEHTFVVRPSIGIVSFPRHGYDGDTLIRRADMAMYEAKRTQRGYVAFAEEQEQVVVMAQSLRQAIKSGEFHLVYQPKVHMNHGTTRSVEALLRWNHPQLGAIAPDLFIPWAEQMGVISQLTTWVLNEAMTQCQEWVRAGLALCVAVNLSAWDLKDANLPNRLASGLRQYQLAPANLSVEITESAIMQDPAQAMKVLTRLGQLGIKVSIDDFGTGYSSFAYLSQLPVHEIKIDKSFVLTMLSNPTNAIIVRSIIALAHNLSLVVVAEGVETQEIWDALNSLSCDVAQGYLISRPILADDIAAFMRRQP